MFYSTDGAVDNVALLHALTVAVDQSPGIHRIRSDVRAIAFNTTHVSCTIAGTGATVRSSHVVLAAGAWATEIAGLPRPLAVEPYRGQMFAVAASGAATLSHVVYGPDTYIVPRGDRILIGATMERVGFDSNTTDAALASVRAKVAAYWPIVASVPATASWAGLRPVTPDLLPILGPDPTHPALILRVRTLAKWDPHGAAHRRLRRGTRHRLRRAIRSQCIPRGAICRGRPAAVRRSRQPRL